MHAPDGDGYVRWCFLNTFCILGLRSKLRVYLNHLSRSQEAGNICVSVGSQEAGR